jgi:hypothetical protein
MAKKFIFSTGVFGRSRFKIGLKNIKDKNILNEVSNKKVYPTELMFFCFTATRTNSNNAEKKKKNKYNIGIE